MLTAGLLWLQPMNISVAIAMPVYNEADGIQETLELLDDAFSLAGIRTELFIQNDVSTDGTLLAIEGLRDNLKMSVSIETNQSNMGHGPTTWRAYNRAAHSGHPVVLQLDSDGQFNPVQIPPLVHLCDNEGKVVMGNRRARTDPWFRKLITMALRMYLRFRFQLRCSDPNTPVRAYPSQILQILLADVPDNPLIPNIYLALAASGKKISIIEVPIEHRVRRGTSTTGTMWSRENIRLVFVPKRLIKFCQLAFRELKTFGKAHNH